MQSIKVSPPTRATAADLVGKEVPFTLYEVVQTMRDDVFVSAEVKPVTITWHGIRTEVGATAPSVTFVGSDGRQGWGNADLFYLTEVEAMKEVALLMPDRRPTEAPVLDVNGRRFVHFEGRARQEQSGFYREKPNGILFFGNDKEPFAFAVTNPKQGLFFVSCSRHGSGVRYMHSTSSVDERRLGIEGVGLSAQHDLVCALVNQLHGKDVLWTGEDAKILQLALGNLAALLADPCSADRCSMGAEKADRWADRCNAMLESLESEGKGEHRSTLLALRK
ncbi:hypothetical protein [Ralstonia sp. GX3-BWBA]|uniref:hypothetical protein n=1 Tax=Ralstonia sp. GX3-BWBA TaxID=2219865 RepID=UPI000DD2D6C3|nr:hypothetical protein [Ralstonia sp. GX3-BWBA]